MEELIEYIHRSLSHGGTLPHIKQHLSDAGWSEQEINTAIHEATQTEPHSFHKRPKKRTSKLWLIFVLGVILIFAAVFLAILLYEKPTGPQETGIVDSPALEETGTIEQVDCGIDDSCFIARLEKCEPTKFTSGLGPQIQFAITIKGAEGSDCLIHYLVTANPMPIFKDTEMDCRIPKKAYTVEEYEQYFQENILNICQGTYIEAMQSLGTIF